MKKFFVILMILVFSPSMAVASYIDRQLKEVVKIPDIILFRNIIEVITHIRT